jgi:hypothetical protein
LPIFDSNLRFLSLIGALNSGMLYQNARHSAEFLKYVGAAVSPNVNGWRLAREAQRTEVTLLNLNTVRVQGRLAPSGVPIPCAFSKSGRSGLALSSRLPLIENLLRDRHPANILI